MNFGISHQEAHNMQHTTESTLDKSFEDLVNKILATEDDCPSPDSLNTQLTLTQELLDNLTTGNCFESGVPPWKQAPLPDISGLSSAQLIQEALAFMRQNGNLQDSQMGGMSLQTPYTPERRNGDGDFCNPPGLSMAHGEEESTYSGIGSPRSSVAGSYSSGDEVGWPNIALAKGDAEMVNPQYINRNSPQLGNRSTECAFDNHALINMKPTQQMFESQPHYGSPAASREDLVTSFTTNRSSPSMMTEGTGMFPDYGNQMPSAIADFRNMNNSTGVALGRASPLCHSPRPLDSYSMNGNPTKLPQQPPESVPFVPGPTFNNRGNCDIPPRYRASQWKNQQNFRTGFNNLQPKIDAQMAAGFPRNNVNHRFPNNGRYQAPMWLKRNQPPNLSFQQRGTFAGNYNSLPISPLSPTPPMIMGELASTVEDCHYQLQNLEKERRKTETELVRMNPGKRISSSNTIAVPPLPPNPSPIDQLIAEEYREHSRMTTLLSKIGGLNARALHPNIEICLDKWMSAIQAVEAYRTAEICHTIKGKAVQIAGDGAIIEKIQTLIKATGAARTKLWCALQLSKEKHVPPIKKEILNFVPEGVQLV